MGKWLMAKLLEHSFFVVFILASLVVVPIVVVVLRPSVPVLETEETAGGHVYVTWDTMEYDKCVAAWLITRYFDKKAEFVFISEGEEFEGMGQAFDIPGVQWSRKQGKCTSDCIFQALGMPDERLKEIVTYAHRVELNMWQLERWSETKTSFDEVKLIMDGASSMEDCFERTGEYFDELYKWIFDEGEQ